MIVTPIFGEGLLLGAKRTLAKAATSASANLGSGRHECERDGHQFAQAEGSAKPSRGIQTRGKWKLMAEYVEVESGKRNSCPQLRAAISHAKAVGSSRYRCGHLGAPRAPTAPANEHQFAIGGLPLSENRLSLAEANRR